MEVQLEYVHTLHIRFVHVWLVCSVGDYCINKISASELSRKFIKSVLLVGYYLW